MVCKEGKPKTEFVVPAIFTALTTPIYPKLNVVENR
jgi:hypothetical protein